MRAFGATLEIVHSPTGKNTPGLVPAMMARAKEIASTPMHYATDQFNNRDMLVGYAALGDEGADVLPAPRSGNAPPGHPEERRVHDVVSG